jgi:hypothetical protein
VVRIEARMKGEGRQTLNRRPPTTSAIPIAIPRWMCWIPCERPNIDAGSTSG